MVFGIGHYGNWVRWGLDVANLFAVQEGERWRVQIVWPDNRVHYFGRFVSEQDALAWIAAHKWLTLPVAAESPPTGSNE